MGFVTVINVALLTVMYCLRYKDIAKLRMYIFVMNTGLYVLSTK